MKAHNKSTSLSASNHLAKLGYPMKLLSLLFGNIYWQNITKSRIKCELILTDKVVKQLKTLFFSVWAAHFAHVF